MFHKGAQTALYFLAVIGAITCTKEVYLGIERVLDSKKHKESEVAKNTYKRLDLEQQIDIDDLMDDTILTVLTQPEEEEA